MTGNAVGIAELKARLSQHLRTVRKGETVTVLDRDRPIASIVPYRSEGPLIVHKPEPDAPPLNEFEFPPPLELDPEIDVVELLLELRQGHR